MIVWLVMAEAYCEPERNHHGKFAMSLRRRRSTVLTVGMIVAAAALIGTQPAAADQSGVPAGPAGCQEERNREVVLGALQNVCAEHRTDMVDQYFADNFVQHSPCVPPGGREELKNWWTGMVYAIPDIITTTDQTVTKCAEVVTFRTITGTVVHDLPALGITGNGQQLQFRAADIFRVQNGKITEHWETVDTGPLVTLALGR
ncbi:ester cyclase [Nocardia xishanensis]|uniref:ester cyclase n=1 Tax=Nocardia xishanensis TaxID=238964 RepID=UPI0034245A63